ncbi:Clavaminate synthase-like protein, partial [Coniophora puteana RWD-64-598 SS2]
ACRDVGFAYLINTGIEDGEVQNMFDWSKKLFALPLETKLKAKHPPEGWKHRGYSAVGMEKVSEGFQAKPSPAQHYLKESFDMGSDAPTARLENVWVPEEDLPGFRDASCHFQAVCRHFQMTKLLPALAMGIPGVNDKAFFEKFHKAEDNQLRLLRYPGGEPEVFGKDAQDGRRCGAHSDFGTCTLLFQDDVGGLEVEDPHLPGTFVPVPPVPGAVVFNVGDLLMRWSNDTLRSTLHRVVAPPFAASKDGRVPERYSIPYFMSPDRQAFVECLPGCSGPDRPVRYPSVSAQKYIDDRLNATY